MIMCEGRPTESPIPRWLRFVLTSDRAGSAWYIGAGFFFAPVLAVLSPWPTITAVLWWIIGLAGLWLGLLGIAMAVGLARCCVPAPKYRKPTGARWSTTDPPTNRRLR